MFTTIQICLLLSLLVLMHALTGYSMHTKCALFMQVLMFLPSKNQVLCEYCTFVNIADSIFTFNYNHMRKDSLLRNT